jgi:hypothetical protein
MSTAAKPSSPSSPFGENATYKSGQLVPNAREMQRVCNAQREDFQALIDDVGTSVTTYCRKRPGVAACMLFTLGFYVGWKIKPW